MSQGLGNRRWDALKFGEPSAVCVATPSQARFYEREGVETGRARPTGNYGQGTVQTTNA